MKPSHLALLSGSIGLGIGLTLGAGIGVLATEVGKKAFGTLISVETAPDVTHPVLLRRPGFQLRYPGNWTVDTAEDTYNPDHIFTIVSPGETCRVVFILPTAPVSAEESLREQKTAMERKVLKGAVETPFKNWGKYEGQGLKLSGRLLGVTEGHSRIFAYADAGRSFTVVEILGDERKEASDGLPAFRLIEQSFELRGDSGAEDEAPAPDAGG